MSKNLIRYYAGYMIIFKDGTSKSGEKFVEAPNKSEASSTLQAILRTENPTAKSITITRVVEMPWND